MASKKLLVMDEDLMKSVKILAINRQTTAQDIIIKAIQHYVESFDSIKGGSGSVKVNPIVRPVESDSF